MAAPPPRTPYSDLPAQAFWRSGVAGADPAAPALLWQPKFAIGPETAIFTAGAGFSRHLHRALVARDWAVIDAEPCPVALPPGVAARFGYGQLSARTGPLHSPRQLLQLLAEAMGEFVPADPVRERGGRFHDALRPEVEPDGMGSPAVVAEARAQHLHALLAGLARAELMVLTLSAIEGWEDAASGTLYPTAPGLVTGRYDPACHRLRLFTPAEVAADLRAVLGLARRLAPGLKLLLAVAPEAPEATATGAHVLAATGFARAVLRAVAGELAATVPEIDYFPAHEIAHHPAARGAFLAPGQRDLSEEGLAASLRLFFAALGADDPAAAAPAASLPSAEEEDEDLLICEEALLEAAAPAPAGTPAGAPVTPGNGGRA